LISLFITNEFKAEEREQGKLRNEELRKLECWRNIFRTMKSDLFAMGMQNPWERLKECKVLQSGNLITREYLERPCPRGEENIRSGT
jgi:hypothetical protein